MKKPMTTARCVRRGILLALLAYLLYLIIGALAPFTITPAVSDEFKSSFQAESLYSVGSTDRAGLIFDNTEALDVRLRIIGEAKQRIVFTSFDMRDCESTRDILAAMLMAARRGVDIKLLVDGMNGLISMSGSPVFRTLGRLPNVEIRYYNEPSALRPWTFNGRMHDKYVIVDQQFLLLGGRNSFDLFLGDYVPDEQKSHDQDVFIYNTAATTERSAIAQVETYFRSNWDAPYTETKLDTQPLFAGDVDAAEAMLETRYAALDRENPALFSAGAADFVAKTVPIAGATLLHNPTNILAKEPTLWWQMQQLIAGAADDATIQTPYAVLDTRMYAGLTEAAQTVPVRLILNSAAVGDNIVASADYLHSKRDLQKTGIQLWEWFGDYSSHGKSLLIDDQLTLIGSFNWDLRSTYIDTELMLAIHSEELNALMRAHMDTMFERSLQAAPTGNTYLPSTTATYRAPSGKKALLIPPASWILRPFRFLV